MASVDFILDFGVFYKGFPIELSIWVESWGFVTIFVTYLCFADVGTKISPKPVIPHNPSLHLFRGVGATKMLGLWPIKGSVHLEKGVRAT